MVKIVPVRRVNPQDVEAPQKFYAAAVADGKVDLKRLARNISKRCTVTRTDCLAVLDAFMDSIIEELEDGKRVELGEFGTFAITVRSNGEESAEEVTSNNVRKAHMRFRPGKEFRSMLRRLEFSRAG
jgi:predicted histone-like DNA-binding protein